MILDLDTTFMDGPLHKRVKATVRRRELPPCLRNFIQKPLLILLMRMALMKCEKIAAMLYLTAYSYIHAANSGSETVCHVARGEALRHSCAR